MLKTIILPILTLLFFFSAGNAQEKWSLEKCVQYAQQNNLSLKLSDLSVRNARLNEKGDRLSRYPSLNASGNGGEQYGRSINPITNAYENNSLGYNSWSVTANVTLFNGGRINNSIKQSQNDAAAAKADAEQTANDIALNVALAYLNILFSEDQLENARNRLSLTETQLDQTNRLIRAGTRPESDRLDIEAQKAQDDVLLIDTAGRLHNKEGLMAELAKILRVLQKIDPTDPQ